MREPKKGESLADYRKAMIGDPDLCQQWPRLAQREQRIEQMHADFEGSVNQSPDPVALNAEKEAAADGQADKPKPKKKTKKKTKPKK